MAKRRHKKARHGRRKRRLSAKQRRAMMRNLRKARKALRGKRRRKGGKRRKSRRSRKSRRRSSSRRRRHHGGGGRRGLSFKAAQVYQRLIDRGRTPQQAHKVAARIDRMRTGRVKRYFEREAMEAKTKGQLANLFANLGSAGHVAAKLA